MSQMPDKIWLHKDTKYSTADTVCGYQYKFLAENEGIENFVEYTRIDALIEKAVQFIKEHFQFEDPSWYKDGEPTVKDEAIEDFIIYMKRE